MNRFRWIIYLHSGLGGGRFMRVESIEEAKQELWGESLQVWHSDDLLCDMHPYTEDVWTEIKEDLTNDCQPSVEPGFNSRRLSFGPRGGINMERF